MPGSFKKMLRKLDAKHDALLQCYDDEDLHQLRVTLRRIRSLLRYHHGRRARGLRHALGRLAATTGAARDWDTLVTRASASLGATQFALVQHWLQAQQEASHRSVVAMLHSDAWARTIKDAKRFSRRHGKALAIAAMSDVSLAEARQRVYQTWRKAEAADDNKHWHKLRVAIKEWRYGLENSPESTRETTLHHCKYLQDNLGIWHDTIVHLDMLHKYSVDIDRVANHAVYETLNTWCQQLESEAREYLDQTRLTLRSIELLLH